MRKLIGTLVLTLWSVSVAAQNNELTIKITDFVEGAIPIAVVPFEWLATTPAPTDVAEVIDADLARSGEFKPLERLDFPGVPYELSDVIFRDWQLLRVDHLVIGKLKDLGDGRYLVQYRLLDVLRGDESLNAQFTVAQNNLRGVAHHIADEIYEHITGRRGAFNTRIAYVTETQGADGEPRYSLNVADSDGHNRRNVLTSTQPVLSPAWSPDGKYLAYVSYERRQAQIIVQELATGTRRLMSSFPGLNGAPAWSPDGTQLAVTLSKDGNPEIYTLDVATKRLRRVTKNVGIDTEPSWSPDGESIIFTSDRSGGPQIYQVPALGGRANRLTFEGKYNARASFSPDGSKIVMVHSADRGFQIAVLDVETQDFNVLTQSRLDESPSFAPNGSMILYATTDSGGPTLAAVSVDGRVKQRLAVRAGGVREPAWSPFRARN